MNVLLVDGSDHAALRDGVRVGRIRIPLRGRRRRYYAKPSVIGKARAPAPGPSSFEPDQSNWFGGGGGGVKVDAQVVLVPPK